MAEARLGVGFRFSVTHDGHLDIDYDRELFALIYHAGRRAWVKRALRFLNSLRNSVFPVGPEILLGNVIIITVLHLIGFDFGIGITQAVVNGWNLQGLVWISTCLISAMISSLLAIALMRALLRQLFSFQGWMYLEHHQMKNPPLHMKLWFNVVAALTSLRILGHPTRKGKPLLYSYQGAMPAMPLPSVQDTLKRHLESVRPLFNDKEYEEMAALSREFETSMAPRLQRYLWLKWLWSDNYVSDWWEEYVYLRSRSPLMINSNFYIMDALYTHPTTNQAARAANVIHSAFGFRRLVQKQETAPLMVMNVIPLCSQQYDRLFNTTRIPGEAGDTLLTQSDSTHIVVLYRGKFYRVACYRKNRLLTPPEIQLQIQGILDDAETPSDPGEDLIATMTASKRTDWYDVRNRFFSRGMNRSSMSMIDTAAFFLVLDDFDHEIDHMEPSTLADNGKVLLHGRGNDRWYDKSICVVVSKNGRIGCNAEHAWADAPISGHFWEYILFNDIKVLGYDESGNCNGEVLRPPSAATKLRWEIPDECANIMKRSLSVAKEAIDDLDLWIEVFDDYGKGEVKKQKLSPDAWVQMALQLAQKRDTGKFRLTYEASMTRLFKEGRTETVRPCTVEAVQFVEAVTEKTKPRGELRDLLKRACSRHQRLYQDAMTGKGVDRHLFCLYVVSKYLELDSPFLKQVLSEPWRLSTSQTPQRAEFCNPRDHPELISCGGGFGPVDDDGYGVSYAILGEDRIFFHVSCKRHSQTTDARRFAKNIVRALHDLREICNE